MGAMQNLNGKLNGKKRYVAGGGITIIGVIYFIIQFILGMNTVVIATEVTVKQQSKIIEQLLKLPERMKGVEVAQQAMKEALDKSEERQEKVNDRQVKVNDTISRKPNVVQNYGLNLLKCHYFLRLFFVLNSYI